MVVKIHIALDSADQGLLLLALEEKISWCRGHAYSNALKAYEQLYGRIQYAIKNGETYDRAADEQRG